MGMGPGKPWECKSCTGSSPPLLHLLLPPPSSLASVPPVLLISKLSFCLTFSSSHMTGREIATAVCEASVYLLQL